MLLGRAGAKLRALLCRLWPQHPLSSEMEILAPDVYSCPANRCVNNGQNEFCSLSCGWFTGSCVSQNFWSHGWLSSHLITKLVIENTSQEG